LPVSASHVCVCVDTLILLAEARHEYHYGNFSCTRRAYIDAGHWTRELGKWSQQFTVRSRVLTDRKWQRLTVKALILMPLSVHRCLASPRVLMIIWADCPGSELHPIDQFTQQQTPIVTEHFAWCPISDFYDRTFSETAERDI
jgi:hypothetical protein